jgi:hypothetical protein
MEINKWGEERMTEVKAEGENIGRQQEKRRNN